MKATAVVALSLLLPLAAPAAPPAPPDLPRGTVVPRVVCAADPSRSYALYLPSGYRADRKWPVVYVFDSRGIPSDREMIEVYRTGAERYGMVLAASNDSSNVIPMDENVRSFRAMWADTHARLAVDDRRAYVAAFSGLVRFATTLALTAPDSLAGIVGASGGFPVGRPPVREAPFPFYGLVGERDFNYYEMLDLEGQLEKVGQPYHLELFDGSHQWPPDELATRSLGWLELQAMKRGTRERDAALVDALWTEDLGRARALEAEGRVWRAWRAYRAAAADFAGLREVEEASAKAAALAAAEPFARDRKAREARDRRDRSFLERAPERFQAAAAREIRPGSVGELLDDLGVPDLKRRERSADAEERLSAQRVLYALYIQTGLYLPRSYSERKQWDRAILFLQAAAEIDPESPRIPYRLAVAHANAGDRRAALDALDRAVHRGGARRAEVEAEPAFAALRGEERYRRILEILEQRERGDG